jgi:hypothetical protein
LLTLYEGQDYEIREQMVAYASIGLVKVKVFLPRPECELSSESWTPEEWNKRFRQTFIRRS